MKKHARICAISVVLVLCLAVGIAFSVRGDDTSMDFQLGKFFAQFQKDDGSDQTQGQAGIAAAYKGKPVTWADIEYQRSVNPVRTEKKYHNETDFEIAQRLLAGMILLEEADRQGLTATQAEVDQMLADTRSSYETSPEFRSATDEYCAGAGITFEEYMEILAEQAPRTLSRQKLRKQFSEDFYAAHEGGGVTYEDEQSAYDAYRAELLAQHAADIVYYMPVEK